MKPASSLAVIKVGGSLFDWPLLPGRLIAFLEAIQDGGLANRTVLIAGGGAAVDVIRTLDRLHRLGDETAHQLALHALDLTAVVLAAIVPGSVMIDEIEALAAAWERRLIPIMAPRRVLEAIESSHSDALPASWAVTSDTIAARIAAHLGADRLILLKSAPLPESATLEDAARLGLVDPILPAAAGTLARVEYLNLRGSAHEPSVLLP